MDVLSMKGLLEAGVHFGHQVKRWDPRMKPYIYTERNGIHIIDLQKTVEKSKVAYDYLRDMVAKKAKILFVGTKKQAQKSVMASAQKCSQFYVTERWLGGMLTNFVTIKKSITRLKKLEKMEVDGTFDSLTKKECIKIKKSQQRLDRFIGGVKEMDSLPDVLVVIDPKQEHIAVSEAIKMNIPVVAIVDSNCNPELIDYPIPGNDDAVRSITLFMNIFSHAVLEGESIYAKDIAESYKVADDLKDELDVGQKVSNQVDDEKIDDKFDAGDVKLEGEKK